MGGALVILLTVIAAAVLALLPLPQFVPPEMGFLRPDWMAMVLIYWIISLPHRIGIVSAWMVGIVMDVLLGSLLGQHALAYVVIAYLVASFHQRLRMFAVWQQGLMVFLLLGLNGLINFWVESITGLSSWSIWYLLPALTGALLWPWVFLLLRYLRQRLSLS